MPDKTGGRGHKVIESDVKKYAVEQGLPVLQPEKLRDPEFIATLKDINADLFIVIAFRMMPEVVWGMPRLGTFNLHGSLLPKYRGAAPINRAIMNGETKTGVTTFFLNHEIDMGDIIDSRSIQIGENENVGSVYDRLMHLGADMVIETVKILRTAPCSRSRSRRVSLSLHPKYSRRTAASTGTAPQGMCTTRCAAFPPTLPHLPQ